MKRKANYTSLDVAAVIAKNIDVGRVFLRSKKPGQFLVNIETRSRKGLFINTEDGYESRNNRKCRLVGADRLGRISIDRLFGRK